MMPDKFMQALLASDDLRQSVLVVVVFVILSIGKQLVSGWIANRSKQTDRHGVVGDQWHEMAKKTRQELSELRDNQVSYLVAKVKELEIEANEWRDAAADRQAKYLLAISVSEQQRVLIEELERQVERQQEQINSLLAATNNNE